jgi:hypothetical protein
MSALGQKQTTRNVRVMSALPPIADIRWCRWDVRKVPEADIVGSYVATHIDPLNVANRTQVMSPSGRALRPAAMIVRSCHRA